MRSDGSPRRAMKSGTCAGLDAVALAHLGRADPRELRTPRTGCSTVTRSETSWNASRSEVATSTGPSQVAAAAARKSSAS